MYQNKVYPLVVWFMLSLVGLDVQEDFHGYFSGEREKGLAYGVKKLTER